MKVYIQANGRAQNLIVQPGIDDSRDQWFEVHATSRNSPPGTPQFVKTARCYPVSFSEGVAEVDDELGKYMIRKKMAFAEPYNPNWWTRALGAIQGAMS